MSSTQKLTPPQRGMRVTGDRETKIVTQLRRLIRGGSGIVVQAAGDQVTISAKRGPITPRTTGGTAGGGSGRFSVPEVDDLPAVPTAAQVLQLVYWTSEGDGTGDDGIWYAYTGMTRWYPLGHYTTLDGTPGAEQLT